MWRSIRWGTAACLLASSLVAGFVKEKLGFSSGESALAKGLDKDNAPLAKELLVATLIERANTTSKRIFGSSSPDPNWPRFRQFALEDLDKAAKMNPEQPEALYLVAQLNLLPGGDAKRAAKALDDAIRLSPKEPMLRARALVLRAGLQKSTDKKLADLSEAIRIAPNNVAALRQRAALYADGEKLEQAMADLKAAAKLEPDRATTYEEQAIVLARLKKYEEAFKLLEKARKLRPNSADPLVQKARIHAMQSNFKAALEDLSDALLTEPNSPGALLLRATIYQAMDEDEKALADADRLLELRPGLPMIMRLRAGLLAGQGKFEEALKQLEDLLKLAPDDVETQLQAALLYGAARKTQKAIDTYTAILARQPDNWSALRGRGDMLLTTGKHAQAIADFEKALKLRPKDSAVLNNFAWVLATSPNDKLRNGKRAVKLATLACEVTKYEQAHILSTLAAAYAEAGDFTSAMKWSQKAVELGKADQKAALAKELASYRAGKPWRELLLEPEPIKPSQFRSKKAAPPPSPKPKAPESPKPPPSSKPKPASPKPQPAKKDASSAPSSRGG